MILYYGSYNLSPKISYTVLNLKLIQLKIPRMEKDCRFDPSLISLKRSNSYFFLIPFTQPEPENYDWSQNEPNKGLAIILCTLILKLTQAWVLWGKICISRRTRAFLFFLLLVCLFSTIRSFNAHIIARNNAVVRANKEKQKDNTTIQII